MTWPSALRRLRPFFSQSAKCPPDLCSWGGGWGGGGVSITCQGELTLLLTALQSLSLACGEILPP